MSYDQEETGDVLGLAVMFRCAQHGTYSVGQMDSTLCPTCRKPMDEDDRPEPGYHRSPRSNLARGAQ